MKTNNFIRRSWVPGCVLMSWDRRTDSYGPATVVQCLGSALMMVETNWKGKTEQRMVNRYYFDVKPLTGEIDEMLQKLYPDFDHGIKVTK